nr:uncharacterized protein LOC132780524 [Anolis sagrei ordinatus]
MRFGAVFLALAVLTGSYASFLSDEPRRPRLEQIHDTIREYIDKISKSTSDNLQTIRNSELGREINARVSDSLASAQSYQAELQKQLPPVAQDLLQKIITDLKQVNEKMQPFAEELNQKMQGGVSQLQERLAPFAEDLLEQAEQHTQTLRQALASGTEELKANLQRNVEDLQAQLGPLAEDMKGKIQQQVEDFRQGVEPLAQRLQGSLSEGLHHVRHNLHPYAEDLHQKLVPLAENLQGQLSGLWNAFRERFQFLVRLVHFDHYGPNVLLQPLHAPNRLGGHWVDVHWILVAHYLQSITPCLALGGELVYHHRPGEEGTLMSLAGKYTAPNWIGTLTVGQTGAHATYYHKASDQLQVGVEFEASTRMQDTSVTFGYQLDLPKANLLFRGSVDSNWIVGATLEKKLPPLPLTLAMGAFLNHRKNKFQCGFEYKYKRRGANKPTREKPAACRASPSGPVAIMRFGAVFLALAVLTGSYASFLSDEPRRPRLEQIHDTIREYIDKISKSTSDNLQTIRNSELGREINARVSDSLASAQSYQAELQKQLPPVAQDLLQKIITDLKQVNEKMQPFAEELNQKMQGGVSQLQERLAPFAEDLLEQAEQHTQTLRQALASGTEELKANLQRNVEDLQAQLGPLAEDMKGKIQQQVEDFRQGVEPLAQRLQGSLSEGLHHVRHNLHPYAEDLHQKLVPLAENLQGQLSGLWNAFRERFQ